MTADFAETFGDLLASFSQAIRPWIEDTTRADSARLMMAIYHYSRNAAGRLERTTRCQPLLADLLRESCRWTRGLYLLALLDLETSGLDPGLRVPASVERYDRWWELVGCADEALAVGALLAEPYIVGRVSACLRALGPVRGHPQALGRIASLQAQEVAAPAWQRAAALPRARLLEGASAAARSWFEMVTADARVAPVARDHAA